MSRGPPAIGTDRRSDARGSRRRSRRPVSADTPGGWRYRSWRPVCRSGTDWCRGIVACEAVSVGMCQWQRPKQKEAAMIIDCALYKDGKRQHQGPMSVEEAAARQAQGGFVWVGMYEPTAEE